MHGEAGSWLDTVVIPNYEWRISGFIRIVIIAEVEVIMGIQPTIVVIAQFRKWKDCDHTVFNLILTGIVASIQ